MAEKVSRYEAIQFVCFEVKGKDLNPDKVNPIIQEFHIKLDNFRYKEPPLTIFPTAVDEFKIQEISDSLLIGSYQIRWEIVDLDGETAMYRKNNDIRPLLTREMMKIEVKGWERGSRRIKMKIINSRFSDELKTGIWPNVRPEIVTF